MIPQFSPGDLVEYRQGDYSFRGRISSQRHWKDGEPAFEGAGVGPLCVERIICRVDALDNDEDFLNVNQNDLIPYVPFKQGDVVVNRKCAVGIFEVENILHQQAELIKKTTGFPHERWLARLLTGPAKGKEVDVPASFIDRI